MNQPSSVTPGGKEDDEEFVTGPDLPSPVFRIDYLDLDMGIKIGMHVPPDPPTLDTMNGWLSPDGDLLPCVDLGHNNLASRIECQRSILNIEKAGWIKLLRGKWYLGARDPTQRQIDTAFDWATKHGRAMEWWFGGEKPWETTVLIDPGPISYIEDTERERSGD